MNNSLHPLIISLVFFTSLFAKCPEADYIVVGAGAAGATLAKLLSEKHSVILLEAGTDQDNNPLITTPTSSGSLVLTYTNEFFWGLGHALLEGSPNNKRFPAVLGELLGGGSSVNGMQYVRGTTNFFTTWETISGDPAWGPVNAFKVYKQLERFNGVPGQFNPSDHGFSGPVDIRQCAANLPAAKAFLAAVTSLSPNYPAITDYNAASTPQGAFLYWQVFQDPDKTRESSSKAYLTLTPDSENPNIFHDGKLTLYLQAQAIKVLFDSKKDKPHAQAVKALFNNEEVTFKARKKIILSTGFQSALILMRSGIGDKATLESFNIPVLVDNPNVGQHLRNHVIVTLTGTGTVGSITDPQALYSGGAFLPSVTDLNDRAFELIGVSSPTTFTIATLLLRTQSTGFMTLLESSALRMPFFDFAFFSDPADINMAVEAYQIEYNTLTKMGLTLPATAPKPTDIPGIKTFVLATYSQAYHYTGACRMAQTAADGVVDSNGRVFGVSGLIIADDSIIPMEPVGNTAGPAFLIGNVIAKKELKS
jgi:choline dehydrogenase